MSWESRHREYQRMMRETPEGIREAKVRTRVSEILDEERPKVFPQITPENFQAALDWQKDRYRELFEELMGEAENDS